MSALGRILLALVVAGLGAQTAALASNRQDLNDKVVRGLALVDSLLAVPDAQAAVAAAAQLREQFGDNLAYGWQIEGRLGLALLQAGAPGEALPFLENVTRRQPGDAIHHRNLGATLLQLKRRGRALSEYRTAVELAPGAADLRREYGQLLLSFGDTRQAARELLTASRLCGGCAQLDQPLASLYLVQGKFAEAVPLLERINERDPQPANRRALVGALAKARQDSALIALVGGLEPELRTVTEWRLLVEAEGRRQGHSHSLQAVTQMQDGSLSPQLMRGVEIAPFWGQIALNLLAAHELSAGLVAADEAIKLDPQNVVYRNNRVVFLTRLGRDAEARREWQRVQEMAPDGAAKEKP